MKRNSLLLFGLAFILSACATASQPSASGLTFVHLNDTYRVGAVEDGNAGGFSRVVTLVRGLQAEGRDVRILHGGDFLYPSLESQLWNGLQMVDAFNFMDSVAPMYAVSGNHEFDRRGPEQLVAAIRESNFDWLGDNYRFETGAADVDEALRSAFTFEYNGKKIGIFSLTLHADDGGNARPYVPIDKNYLDIAEKTIAEFESRGVDAIIGLTHLHMWQDAEIARLREKHPRFVFMVGGHEHEPEFRPLTEGSASVMKGASNARVIWTIDLDFDTNGMPLVRSKKRTLDRSVAFDPEYQVLRINGVIVCSKNSLSLKRRWALRRCRSTGAR